MFLTWLRISCWARLLNLKLQIIAYTIYCLGLIKTGRKYHDGCQQKQSIATAVGGDQKIFTKLGEIGDIAEAVETLQHFNQHAVDGIWNTVMET